MTEPPVLSTSFKPILEWVIETLWHECDVLALPGTRLFEEELIDSLGLTQLLTAIEERWQLDYGMREFDRDSWATPIHIAWDISGELTRASR